MPEEDAQGMGRDEGQQQSTNWYDGDEEITGNPDVLKYVKDHDFKSAGAMAKTGSELQKKLGSSFRLPDDPSGLNEEQIGQLYGVVRKLKNVPEKPDGYEIPKPTLPEGLPYDENLELAFRAFMHEKGYGQKEVNDLYSFYNNARVATHNKQTEQANQEYAKAEQDFRVRKGIDYDNTMENIKRFRLWVTEKLGFGYVDSETGKTASRFDDCLNRTKLGNSIELNEAMDLVYRTYIAEGQPVKGSGEEGGVSSGMLSDSFYEKPT